MKKCILNQKNNKNVIPWFLFFCSISIIYVSFTINIWYLFFIIIPLFNIRIIIKLKNFIFWFLILIVFVAYIILIQKIQLKIELSNIFIFKLNSFIQQKICLFLEKKYEVELVSFIKLILLNIKSQNTYTIFRQSVDLGVAWLLQSSGYHIHILICIIMIFFKKNKKISYAISILICCGYLILLKVSYAILKMLFQLVLKQLFSKFYINNLNQIGIIGLIICTINPLCFGNYGFVLSILISIVSQWVKLLNLNNKIIQQLIFNLTIQLVTLPIIMKITSKISIVGIISSFVFYYIISFVFLYFLIFSWFPFMIIVHKAIVYSFCTLLGNISFNNLYIKSFKWEDWWILVYYLLMYLTSKFSSFLIKTYSI